MTGPSGTEDLLRRLAPQVLGTLVRRQRAVPDRGGRHPGGLLQAATEWPRSGVPENPRAWLLTVASRRLTDLIRAEQARRRREETAALSTFPLADAALPPTRRRPMRTTASCCSSSADTRR